jgi:O-antigen/teichoic acid export membrane protein
MTTTMEEPSFKTRVKSAFVWLGTGTFIGQLVSWVSTILVIRMLAPSDYGLMAMAGTVIAMIAMLSEIGVGASIIQAEGITQEDLEHIFGLVLMTSFAGAFLCFASAPLVAGFYNEPRLILLMRVLCVNFLVMSVYIVPQALFQRDMDFRAKVAVDMSSQIASSLATLLLASQGAGVWSLVIGQIVLHTMRAAGFNLARRTWWRPRYSWKKAGRFIRYGLTLTVDRIVYYLYTIADTVIVGRFLGNALLGNYAIAMNLATIPAEKVMPIITQVSFTSYSRIQNDMARIRRNLLRTVSLVAYAAFPVFFGMAAVAPEAIRLLLGPKWTAIIVPFQLICLILPLKAVNPILSPAVFAIGKPRINLVNMIITLGIMGTAFLVGVRAGITGVALAWVLAYPVVFLITTRRCLRTLRLPVRFFFAELRFPFTAGAAMLFSLLAAKAILVRLQPLPVLLLLIVSGAAIYAAAVLVFRRNDFLKLKGLIQK